MDKPPTPGPRRVILESPFAPRKTAEGDAFKLELAANIRYARACMRDSIMRGEAPMASHLLYTQEGILDDTRPMERMIGIEAGLAWGDAAEASVVYIDRGISDGMRYGIRRALDVDRSIEFRTLYPSTSSVVPPTMI